MDYFMPDRIRDHKNVNVRFYDKPNEIVDLVPIMKRSDFCVEEKFSDIFVRKLYKSILVEILGKENLGYYSAANNPHDGNVAIPKALFTGIEDLILQGFGVPSNKTSQTTAHCRCVLDVKQIIKKTNGYLFINERRDEKTPKRKMPPSMKSGKKKKTENADEEAQNVLANDRNSTPKRPAKRKPKNKKAAEKSPEILIVEPQAIPSSDESSDEEQ